MDRVIAEFEEYASDLLVRIRDGGLIGTDGELSRTQAEELIEEFRAKLHAEDEPSQGRVLLERFRESAGRL